MTPPEEQLFPWPILKAMVGGTSALDLPRLNVRTFREAEGFLERYGFDWSLESDRGCRGDPVGCTPIYGG